MPRVVLDSSVLVSGFLTGGGPSATLLDLYREGAFEVYYSEWIVAEVERALRRPRNIDRYRYTQEDVADFLDGLRESARLVRGASVVVPVTRDPSADPIIACAIAARADYLVTGDRDMLVLAEHQGIRILGPRAFLDLLARE
jgi:uncharacterized protein